MTIADNGRITNMGLIVGKTAMMVYLFMLVVTTEHV